jgi:hypothetical protein
MLRPEGEYLICLSEDEIILYRPNELAEHIEVKLDDDTVWLSQQQIFNFIVNKSVFHHLSGTIYTVYIVGFPIKSYLKLHPRKPFNSQPLPKLRFS